MVFFEIPHFLAEHAGFAFAVFMCALCYLLSCCGHRAPNAPAGPSTLPILGNLLIFPRKYLHLKFTEWAKVYGDVFSLKVLNQTIIVINTPSLAHLLIDKHALSSSNRPKSIIADMITPDNMNMGTGRFANATWKAMRKASGHILSNENIRRLDKYQHAEAAQLMSDFVRDPQEWYQHIRRFTTSFMLGIVYGNRGPTLSSPDVADFLDVHPRFLDALEFGTMPPVDLFPFLTLVPERWANWKRTVRDVRVRHEMLYGRLLSKVENRLKYGPGVGAFMEQAIRRANDWGLNSRNHLLHLGGTLLEGSDTSSATIQNTILALARFPQCQLKARGEVDRVVGKDRAPIWDDLPNLPYTMAFIEECSRYRPVGPLGLPHEMVKDEIIDGVLYPKDSVVFINVWAIMHDERYFDRPEEFRPERFLRHPFGIKEGIEDDPDRRANLQFGGGRRVCPGIMVAKTSLELNVANFVWGFEFLPMLDPVSGKDVYPSMDNYTTGITATPQPFPIRIVPRSTQHREIIERQFEAASGLLAAYEVEVDSAGNPSTSVSEKGGAI